MDGDEMVDIQLNMIGLSRIEIYIYISESDCLLSLFLNQERNLI